MLLDTRIDDLPATAKSVALMALQDAGFVGRLRSGATFAELTTYRLGGPIALLAEPSRAADFPILGAWLAERRAEGALWPVYFIGGGTNLLASSRPFEGLVIKLGEAFNRITPEPGPTLRVGGATQTAHLLKYCRQLQLGGLEVLAGVPGSTGGAVVMNAGTMKDWLEVVIESVTVVDRQWQIATLRPEECGFRYRGSRLLDEGLRVLEASFRMTPGIDIGPHVRDHLAMRRKTQPGGRNAGSNFKNPVGLSAGKLIDEAGCKGWREGGAVVSDLHANFIQAEEGCTPEDVYALMQRVARRVQEVHGVRLEPEVALLNFEEVWNG